MRLLTSKHKTIGFLTSFYIGCLIIACVVLLTLPIGCSNERPIIPINREIPISRETFSFDQGTYPTQLDLFPEYRLSPGDVLDVLFQIRTWRRRNEFKIGISHTISVHFINIPSLNQTERVLPDGTIVLPYLGNVTVIGKTIPELTKELEERYKNILRHPDIYITVPEFRSRIKELKHDLHTAPRGLSRLVTIRPDGYVTFPLVGDVFAAHRTIPEVKKILNKRYNAYLPGLHVDLFLQKSAGSFVYLVGEVKKVGAYKIIKPISVLEAITLAGGYTHNANLSSVIVFRRHERKIIARGLNLKDVLHASRNASFFYLRPDDIVYVPRTKISTLGQLMRQIADIALFNGWGSSTSWNVNFKPQ